MLPNGDADLGGSTGTSFHRSLGEKTAAEAVSDPDAGRGEGLKAEAFAFSMRGEVEGESAPLSLDDCACLAEIGGEDIASRARPDRVRCNVGV